MVREIISRTIFFTDKRWCNVNDNFKELIADIDHAEHVSRQNTIDAIMSVDQKQQDLKYYSKNHVRPNRDATRPFTRNINNPIPDNKSYADYDFKGHDVHQGRINRDIASLLMEVCDYSRIVHHQNPSSGRLYNSRFGANNAKYVKTKELIEALNKSKEPNFIKVTIVPDSVGLLDARRAYVFFAEFSIPEGEYMISWHLERNKQPASKSVCSFIDRCNYDNSCIRKCGKKRKEEYAEKEKEYKVFTEGKRAGDPARDALHHAFDLI